MNPQKPNSSMGSSVTLESAAWIFFSTLIAFGPTKIRACVGPLLLPSATPRMGSSRGFVGGELDPNPTRLMVFETSSWLCSVTMLVPAGESGRNTAAKNISATPAKSNGPPMVSPEFTFFGSIFAKLPLR